MLSGIVSAMLLLLFGVGSLWAYSPRRKPEFDAAAKLPLDDDSGPGKTEEETSR